MKQAVHRPTPLSTPRLLRYPRGQMRISSCDRFPEVIGSLHFGPLVSSSSIITIDPFTWIRLSEVYSYIASLFHGLPTPTYTSLGFRKLEIIATVSGQLSRDEM